MGKQARAAVERINPTAVVVAAELGLAAIAVADRLARRAGAPRADVRMGPGGWVSLKGGRLDARGMRASGRPRREPVQRPLWARMIRAWPI